MTRPRNFAVSVLGVMVTALLGSGVGPAGAHPDAGPEHCWFGGGIHGRADCQERADADWEGLSMKQQESIRATGLTGTRLDQLVIDFRQATLDAAGSSCPRA
jgi:hypothetical protein